MQVKVLIDRLSSPYVHLIDSLSAQPGKPQAGTEIWLAEGEPRSSSTYLQVIALEVILNSLYELLSKGSYRDTAGVSTGTER